MLTAMEVFDVSMNYLESTLPPGLQELASLQTLRVARNQINGSLPESIRNMTALRELTVSYQFGVQARSTSFVPSLESWKAQTWLLHNGRFPTTN